MIQINKDYPTNLYKFIPIFGKEIQNKNTWYDHTAYTIVGRAKFTGRMPLKNKENRKSLM